MAADALSWKTVVTTNALARHLDDESLVVVDCRFELSEPAWGRREYLAGHIPGAVYAHLDGDLSGPIVERSGRHPLPEAEVLRERLASWGIGPGVQVVSYDQDAGLYASRLWWLLRAFGHEAVAVLDGGYAKWMREGRPARPGEEARWPADFAGRFSPDLFVGADEVARLAQSPDHLVIDVRAPERFRGEIEPIDPVAGRIPGAVNRFVRLDLTSDHVLRPVADLRADFTRLLGSVSPRDVVVYCGSGVFSCHTLLAMAYAGLDPGRLYAGSWSEWCRDPARPVARG